MDKNKKQRKQYPFRFPTGFTAEQHEGIRVLAFEQKKSMADIVREAVNQYLKQHTTDKQPVAPLADTAGGLGEV